MCDQLSCDYKVVTVSTDLHGIYMNRPQLPTVTQCLSHALRDSNAYKIILTNFSLQTATLDSVENDPL